MPARGRGPSPWRGRLLVVTSLGLVWTALLLPDHPGRLRWEAWLEVPVEAVVLGVLVLLLPQRAARGVAVLAGGLLWLLVLLAALDLVFRSALDRPFHLVYDRGYAPGAVRLLQDSVGRWAGWATVLAAALVALALLVLLPRALLRLTDLVRSRPRQATPVLAGLAALWLAAGLVTGPAAGTAATRAVDQVARARADLADQRDFDRALARPAPTGDPSFPLFRGSDVLVVFVESYGRTALHSEGVRRALTDAGERLAADGWHTRSGWLTAPTFGGLSWLTHATLHTGLPVDRQDRYDALLAAGHPTLAGMFEDAGWRTAAVVPANHEPWPEGREFYGWDRIHAGDDLGYSGPDFGYAPLPDQVTLAALQRLELDRPAPVFAEVDLVSSHTPWTPSPRLVPARELDDPAVFERMVEQARPTSRVWADPTAIRAAYARSVVYSLRAVTWFLVKHAADDPVVLLVGDHQPARVVTDQDPVRPDGSPTSHDVPVTVLSTDPRVIAAIRHWRWRPGLVPGVRARAWPMPAFHDRFLAAYGEKGAAGRPGR